MPYVSNCDNRSSHHLGQCSVCLQVSFGKRRNYPHEGRGPGRGFGRSWGFNVPLQERIEIYKQIWQLTVGYNIAKLNSVQSQYPARCLLEVVGNESLLSLARNLTLGTVFFTLERGPVLFAPPPFLQSNPLPFKYLCANI